MAGWYAVCDQHPIKGGKWETVKNPMLGVRFIEMDKGNFVNLSDDFIRWVEAYGYLAIRYQKCRYIYEGVPTRIFHVLIGKNRCASMYWRKSQKYEDYPCVEIVKYDSPEAYRADEGPVKEKLAAMAKVRLEAAVSPEMDLFGPVTNGPQPKKRRSSKQRLIGSILEDRP